MTATFDKTLAYLKENYLTREALAQESGVPSARIEELIAGKCLPPHSHEAELTVAVTTAISERHEAMPKRIHYYHRSLVALAIEADSLARAKGLTAAAAEIRRRFEGEVAEAAGSATAETIKGAWKAWCDGTYGVCLKEVAPGNMVRKVAATKTMQTLLDKARSGPLDASEMIELKEATQRYEEVTGPFGPHEVADSTRGRVYEPAMRLLGERTGTLS